jgi:pimeloyl-ACP methyl ester carboxylesterase
MSLPTLAQLVLGAALAAVAGCKSMTPGDLDRVQPHSDAPRAGNVYLLRGFLGIWSHGIDQLGRSINQAGVRAHVYQEDQWRQLCDAIIDRYRHAIAPEPLVLVGHSYGADDAIRIARRLEEAGVRVDLIVTLDPVTPPKVPASVGHCYNIYQPNLLDSLPVFRGVPLEAEEPAAHNVVNVNVRLDRRDLLEPGTNHFNIEKNTRIHAEIVSTISRFCPPRELWLAKAAPAPPPPHQTPPLSPTPAPPVGAAESPAWHIP